MALWAKEALSSIAGYHDQSMAPLIGGSHIDHGKLEPIKKLDPIITKNRDLGTFNGMTEELYSLFPIVIDKDNLILIYKEYNTTTKDAEDLLEAWAFGYYEQTLKEL